MSARKPPHLGLDYQVEFDDPMPAPRWALYVLVALAVGAVLSAVFIALGG